MMAGQSPALGGPVAEEAGIGQVSVASATFIRPAEGNPKSGDTIRMALPSA
jgi:hypothetical protein